MTAGLLLCLCPTRFITILLRSCDDLVTQLSVTGLQHVCNHPVIDFSEICRTIHQQITTMDKEKTRKIIRIYNITRYIIICIFIAFVVIGLSVAGLLNARTITVPNVGLADGMINMMVERKWETPLTSSKL